MYHRGKMSLFAMKTFQGKDLGLGLGLRIIFINYLGYCGIAQTQTLPISTASKIPYQYERD